jgi:hypothetical protein
MNTIRKRTAIMIVHGIGEQQPYETLDSFACGFIQSLNDNGSGLYKRYHLTRACGEGREKWFDSIVRIAPACADPACMHQPQNKCTEELNHVDLHEYYWADSTEDKITVPEINRWIRTTLKGANTYHQENAILQTKYAERNDGQAYGHRLNSILRRSYFLYRFLEIVLWFAKRISWMSKLMDAIENSSTHIVCGYVGDVAIYTNTDRKSKFFGIRQKIITGAHEKLLDLLNDDCYDQVIIAGHSLGSVVSYDLMNKLNIQCNHDRPLREQAQAKLRALITFGSPLDKIAFFFRERASANEHVRKQIISYLHSFKSVPDVNPEGGEWRMENRLERYFDNVPWHNFYHDADPVSGHLDFYSKVINEKIPAFEDKKSNRWGYAHLGYWGHQPMYKQITKEYLVK